MCIYLFISICTYSGLLGNTNTGIFHTGIIQGLCSLIPYQLPVSISKMRTPSKVQTFKHGGRVNSLSSNGGTQAANVAMRISGGGLHVRGLGSKVWGFRVQGLGLKVQVFGYQGLVFTAADRKTCTNPIMGLKEGCL